MTPRAAYWLGVLAGSMSAGEILPAYLSGLLG